MASLLIQPRHSRQKKSLREQSREKPPEIVFHSLKTRQLWRKASVFRKGDQDEVDDTENLKNLEKRNPSARSRVAAIQRPPTITKMMLEIDRLWETSRLLMKKEGAMTEDDIEKLRRIIKEAVDLSSRIRMLIREKDVYTDEDVLSHAKDINSLQLFLHTVVEIWTKVEDVLKEKYGHRVMGEMMELGTDIASVFGEVMSIFLQRFGLNIVPLMRPVHGLFYSISIHCRYHCPGLGEEDVNEMKSIYNSFLTAMLNLMKSTKVLLKRLKFDSETISTRRRTVQTSISSTIDLMHAMVKDGRLCDYEEYVDTIEKIGSLCTDIFFVIGKTSSIVELLELGESVIATEPTDVLGEVAHSDVSRCPIEKRPLVLSGLELDEGSSFVSDVFMQSGATFNPSQKVTIRMPFSGALFPSGAMIKIKLKIGEEWYDTPGIRVLGKPANECDLPEGVAKVNMKSAKGQKKVKPAPPQEDMIEFSAKFHTAFVATLEYMSQIREIVPAGTTYICPEDDRIRVSFPEDCLAHPSHMGFKLIQLNRQRMFDYKEQCPTLCRNILAMSDILKVYHDEDIILQQPVMLHMPIPNDIDDCESELVIFRSRDDGELELIPKKTAMLCPSTQNCYTFQIQSFSGIAIGKVKKKNLRKNRAAVIEEYEIYIEDAFVCNILTFMDKGLLHVGLVKVFVEIVERRFVKKALRRRAKEGLFEVPGSRSPNIKLRNEDIVCIEMEGNIQRMKEIPLENYFIVFLSSARDNYRSFPVEPRKDPENRAYGLLNFYKDNEEEQQFLHSSHIDANKYMLGVLDRAKTHHGGRDRGPGVMSPRSLGGSWTTSRPATTSAKESRSFRAIFDSVPVLSHQSMLVLCTYIKTDTVQNVAYELNVPYDHVLQTKLSGQPSVMINFNILWHWRGDKGSRHKVQELIDAFRLCGQAHIAQKIMDAGNAKRPLTRDDFM
ncbi:uncharacterized protein LOC128235830 [Mya arenaria]|uniref:uncharacterized protein LOC128235830 n=1 Tax=Mya arenaria TaxID=6604 RepID=UPI0022E21693|nr:uncharacterized protein LOC128235830 [Mya arenaria]